MRAGACRPRRSRGRPSVLRLYARGGVPETWLLNVPAGVLEAYHELAPEGYRHERRLARGERSAPQALPDLEVAVVDLLGPYATGRMEPACAVRAQPGQASAVVPLVSRQTPLRCRGRRPMLRCAPSSVVLEQAQKGRGADDAGALVPMEHQQVIVLGDEVVGRGGRGGGNAPAPGCAADRR